MCRRESCSLAEREVSICCVMQVAGGTAGRTAAPHHVLLAQCVPIATRRSMYIMAYTREVAWQLLWAPGVGVVASL